MASNAEAEERHFEYNLELLKKKGHNWTREETLLLISLYEEKKDLFKNVNYKKKQIWEIIAARMSEHGCTARPDQCEGKWKALTLAFRKCEDHNNQSGNSRRECPFYQQLAEVYGYRPNVRPYATASSSGLGDSERTNTQPTKRSHSDENTETPKKKARNSGMSRENETLTWFKEYAQDRKRENERRRERMEQHHQEKLSLLSGLLDVLKDINK